LTTAAERRQGWRPGGMQHLAVHAGRHELYSIMHQGPLSTHKDPGSVVWVYDLNSNIRVRTITLKSLSSSILLSKDDRPLLFSIFIDSSTLDIYDPLKGTHLRSVEHVGTTPALLVNEP
jgi:methylamine dehydrogenase heavy chain